METQYSKSWEAYKKSDDYLRNLYTMQSTGMKQPYIDNILRTAFDAGYNSLPNEQVEHSLPDEIVEAIEILELDNPTETITYERDETPLTKWRKRVESCLREGYKIKRVKTEHGSFEVGETVNAESLKTGDLNLVTIKMFEIANGRIYAHFNNEGNNYRVSQLRKHPSFTFKTEDGVTITDRNQIVYRVIQDSFISEQRWLAHEAVNNTSVKWFASKDNALAYIKRNRKDKSTADIEKAFEEVVGERVDIWFGDVKTLQQKILNALNNK